jgi:hypothetical protein
MARFWAVLGAMVALLGASATMADAGPGPIRYPKAGGKVAQRPVPVKIRVAGKARLVAVKLNGKDIRHDFVRRPGNLMTDRIGASHALRHGVNRLRAVVRTANGKRRIGQIRFRVVGLRPTGPWVTSRS